MIMCESCLKLVGVILRAKDCDDRAEWAFLPVSLAVLCVVSRFHQNRLDLSFRRTHGGLGSVDSECQPETIKILVGAAFLGAVSLLHILKTWNYECREDTDESLLTLATQMQILISTHFIFTKLPSNKHQGLLPQRQLTFLTAPVPFAYCHPSLWKPCDCLDSALFLTVS